MTKFSRIIQGCMTWGKWGKQLSEDQMIGLMKYCIKQGITTFDHADIYGDYSTEEDFGNAFAKANIDRSTIQLISKCGIQYLENARPENKVKHYEYTAKYIIWSAERSLRLLQTEYLDLLLIHRPSPLMEADEIQKAVEQLKNDGKIKAFGVSNFTPMQTDLISTKSNVSVNQVEYSLTQHSAMHNGSLDHMQIHKITPMSWSPLGSVFREEDTEQTQRIKKVLARMTEKYNATEDQLLLAWILKHPSRVHPVIGTTNEDRISNAVKATKIALDLQDWFELLVASQGHKVP